MTLDTTFPNYCISYPWTSTRISLLIAMGCDCSKSRSTSQEEEQSVRDFETLLGFNRHSVNILYTTIKQISPAPHLNKAQLTHLMEKLSLLPCDLGNQAHPLAKFYAWLKTDHDWDSTRLIALGLILGAGSFAQKLTVLMAAYNPEYKKQLTPEEVELFLRDVCMIALKLLPSLAEGMLLEQGLHTLSALVGIYRRKLESTQDEVILYLKSQLLNSEEGPMSESGLGKSKRMLILAQAFSARELRDLAHNFWKFRRSNSFQQSLLQKQINVDSLLT